MKKKDDIILVTVRGLDVPGITARLTGIIAAARGVRIIDIEQTVVHRKLLLSIFLRFSRDAVGAGREPPLLQQLEKCAQELGVSLDVEPFEHRYWEGVDGGDVYAITCLGDDVGAVPLSQIAQILAKYGVNITKIGKMTQRSLSCVELLVEAPPKLNHRTLSRELLALASDVDIDIAIQPANISRRAKRLVVMDMDSTLVAAEAIDELAKKAGVAKEVQAITRAGMEGNIDFTEGLRRRVALLKDFPFRDVEKLARKLPLNRGAERLIRVLKKLGYKIAVISGGFTPFVDHLQKKLGLDFAFANELEVKKGKLTGKLVGRIIDGAAKAMILETIAAAEKLSLDQVIAIGDGANDLPMLSKAGMGIAFHAKDIVRKNAHTSIGHHSGLDSILYLLGISERELKGL
ncbi:MAG: phosphoserine phosphatase SerB [Deltaproteobacteria bacterium]|nr:phosphoserine phosphatase SerB [Deltaproteobacteria bacterium]